MGFKTITELSQINIIVSLDFFSAFKSIAITFGSFFFLLMTHDITFYGEIEIFVEI